MPLALARRGALVALLALAFPSAASACPGAEALPGTTEFVSGAEAATACLLNAERAAAGVPALGAGPATLRAPAVAYAAEMVAGRFFAHDAPDGRTVFDRVTGYTSAFPVWSIGENLGWGERELGTPAAMVRAWMASPGHRRNLLNPEYREVGIGIVAGAPQAVSFASATYVTVFGSRAAGSAPEPSAPVTAPTSSRTTGVTATTASARRTFVTKCRKVTKRRGGKKVVVRSCKRVAVAPARR